VTIKGISPYLRYDDADSALEWMERVLGFTGTVRWHDATGSTYEADIIAGSTTIGVGNSPGTTNLGRNAVLIVHVDDVDAHYERVRAAADTDLDPPRDQPYGPRTFTITDPWGYQWSFWQGHPIPPDPTRSHPIPPEPTRAHPSRTDDRPRFGSR
jgi:uncharacterized glyoxalase superfamily protein PhnB